MSESANWGLDWLPILYLIILTWDLDRLVIQGCDELLWVLNLIKLVWSWISLVGFWDVGTEGFILWKLCLLEGIDEVVVLGFGVMSLVSGLVGNFESCKLIFAFFLSILPSFRGRRGVRECSREGGLVGFCTVVFGNRVEVAFISLACSDKKEAVNGRWLDEKKELLGSSV